jgi:hypothetical protein
MTFMGKCILVEHAAENLQEFRSERLGHAYAHLFPKRWRRVIASAGAFPGKFMDKVTE